MTRPTEPQLDLHAGDCRSCGADVWWAITVAGKRMPVELAPASAPGATADIWQAGQRLPARGGFTLQWIGGELLAIAATSGDRAPFYVSHFSTCPDADQWRTVTVREHERRVGPRAPASGPPAAPPASEHAARDEGMARAMHRAGAAFSAWARDAIERLAKQGEPFNGDDLERLRVDEGIDPPASPNSIGALFASAARRGVIRRSGERRRMAGEGAHARLTDLWVAGWAIGSSGDTEPEGTTDG